MLSGLLFSVITTVIALVHFYWAAGGRVGMTSALPSHDDQPLFTPSPLVTALVGLALLAAALVSLDYVKLFSLPLPDWLSGLGMWTVGAVFLIRAVGDFGYVGFFKRNKGTRFARLDTLFYSPLCLLLAWLAFVTIVTE